MPRGLLLTKVLEANLSRRMSNRNKCDGPLRTEGSEIMLVLIPDKNLMTMLL